MAGKVSKAKRPKRRWIGIALPPSIRSRSDLLNLLETPWFGKFRIKVYDVHPFDSQEAHEARVSLSTSDNVGFAVVCVLLSEYEGVRRAFESNDGQPLSSITSSGKICLVRERLGLPKPRQR